MFNAIKRVLSPGEVGDRRAEQIDGIGADTVLRVLGPVIERRLEALIIQLVKSPPDFDTMLDIRSQIAEVFRIQHELKAMKDRGKEAGEALAEIFQS